MEGCDSVDGVIFNMSTGGGTGSGVGSMTIQRFAVDNSKVISICNLVNPSKNISNIVVEPYNFVLSMQNVLEHSSLTLMNTNEGLKELINKHKSVETPKLNEYNDILGLTMSHFLSCYSHPFTSNNLAHLQTNLVMYPRIHFMTPAYSPFGNNTLVMT